MQGEYVVSPGDAAAWLEEHAIPLEYIEPGQDMDDLISFRGIVGNARIVALGESMRGTHEFFVLKRRLLEYLVKEKGFTLLAIEAGWAEVNLINEYVQTGKGDPAQLLTQLRVWTWNTQELLDLIRWMRAYNEQRGSAPSISFFGFDMQSFDLAMDNVLVYVQQVDAEHVEEVKALYTKFQEYAGDLRAYGELPLASKQQCHAQVQQVFDLLKERREAYEAASSISMFAHALHSARVVLQAEEVFASVDYSLRDRYMAENVEWLLEQAAPGAKIVLWAHNGHISTMVNDAQRRFMGSYLLERYNEELVTVGMSCYQGALNAVDVDQQRGLIVHQVDTPPEDSYEHFFHAIDLPSMMIDFRHLSLEDVAARWLIGPHPYRCVGALYAEAYAESYWQRAQLPYEFDIFIFIQQISPSHLLPLMLQKGVEGEQKTFRKLKTQPRNLHFEIGLTGWMRSAPKGHEVGLETSFAHSGEVCAYLVSTNANKTVFSSIGQSLQAVEYVNKRICLSAYIKTQDVRHYAGLWMRIDDGSKTISFDNMENRPVSGTQDWRRYEVVLDVPVGSKRIVFGILLSGRGQAWLDDVQIDVVNATIPTTDLLRTDHD